MRTESTDIDFRFIEEAQAVDGIRRMVIRVSEGEITIARSEDSQLRYFVELQGIQAELDAWSSKVRKAESIAILEIMENDFVQIWQMQCFYPFTYFGH